MMRRSRTLAWAFATTLLAASIPDATLSAADVEVLAASTATYQVEFRGINAGTITFTLRPEQPGQFVYESRSNARGIARLFVRHEVREASTFAVDGYDIKPLAYVFDDGSSDTTRDTRLEFDWNAGMAKGTHENAPVELSLVPGIQDRLSAQVVVMQHLAAGSGPDKIAFIDGNEVKEYQYVREGETTLKTVLGELAAVIYSSTREGSDRISRIWYAPALGYTPIRAEQLRRGKVETVLTLTKLER